MASTTKINGTAGVLYVQSQAVAHVTETDLSISMATRDISDKSSAGYEEVAEGQLSWEATGTAYLNPTSSLTGDDLSDFIMARTKISISVGKTATSGDPYWNGQGYITSWDISYGLEESVSYSFTIKGTGALTKLAST